jgi:hypothetical protein
MYNMKLLSTYVYHSYCTYFVCVIQIGKFRFCTPKNRKLRAIAETATGHLGLSTESSGKGNIVNINIKTSNEFSGESRSNPAARYENQPNERKHPGSAEVPANKIP